MAELTSMVCTLDASGKYTCGTGGWTGPLPGDPSTSDIYLTATPAFGGIDINFTWPQLNPEAVAYVILYRSLLPDPNSATQRAQFNGSFFYDAINDPTKPLYYYWVRVMSVNGTLSELIGPAWARPKLRIEETIEELTGKIDEGVLAQSLKTEIDRIQLNALGITQEMIDRAENDDALGVRISEVGAFTGETRALLQQEVLARTSADEAFVSTVETLYTTLNGNIAAIQIQQTALVTQFEALAQQVTTLETEFNGELAQVEVRLQTNINTVNGKVTEIGALYTAKVNVNGLIGGFGIYNDGREVEAGFDVDRFWIGRTSANKRKPFIIDGGIVYIDEAAINKLTFSKLRDESGSFIVENGKVKAQYLLVNEASIEDASISTAKIKDAAITSAKIGNAEVGTLSIRGNAVTVPSIVANPTTYNGLGFDQWQLIVAQAVTLDVPGYLQAMFSCTQTFGAGIRDYRFRMTINGTVVAYGGGDWADGFPNLMGAIYGNAGTHIVSVEWWGEDGNVAVTRMNLFTMGAKR